MFERLFAESGFSLDRLRALVEVAASGSIVKAAGNDPVRQSQYSRQIKELEDFFRTRLVERHGKGSRLTVEGRELARISRFFLLGLSNFHRGCLAEEQTFRIGAGATFNRQFLVPVLSNRSRRQGGTRFASEGVTDGEIERRLHDLTLDFGVVGRPDLSRPLQTRIVGQWKLELWVPRALRFSESRARQAFEQGRLPLALARELNDSGLPPNKTWEAALMCDSFLDSRIALDGQEVAALLPCFLAPGKNARAFLRVHLPNIDDAMHSFYLAWNPRLMRLNPHAVRMRDWLAAALSKQITTGSPT